MSTSAAPFELELEDDDDDLSSEAVRKAVRNRRRRHVPEEFEVETPLRDTTGALLGAFFGAMAGMLMSSLKDPK